MEKREGNCKLDIFPYNKQLGRIVFVLFFLEKNSKSRLGKGDILQYDIPMLN